MQLPINHKTYLLEQHLGPQIEVSNWNHHQYTIIGRQLCFEHVQQHAIRYHLLVYAVVVAPKAFVVNPAINENDDLR